MSNYDWMFVSLMALLIGLLVGAWIFYKAEDHRTRALARKLEEQTAIAAYYKERTRGLEDELAGKLRELDNAKEARDKYREFWGDELQKRLELAELVQRHEQAQKDTAEFVTEAIKTAKAEVNRGEVSSGD